LAPTLTAYRYGFVAAAIVAVAGAALALLVDDADAAPTMVRKHAPEGNRAEPHEVVAEAVAATD
jgi:hypothetical protein